MALVTRRNHVPGIKIGIEEHELGIEVGESCMIFGKVVLNLKTKELKMPNPLIIMKEKLNVDKMLKKDKNIALFFTLAWATLSLFSLYHTLKFLKNYIK